MKNNTLKIKRLILDYAGIVLGCFIVSIAFVFFINPYKLVPGGVYGTSIVLHNLFPYFKVGTFGLMISIPLLIMSYFLLGKNIGARTLVASIVGPLSMNLVTSWVYPTEEAMRSLDPALLCGGVLNLKSDLILACIMGPALLGVGEGIMMRCKATSGGSDIVAMLLHKYFRVKFSHALMAVDGIVVLFGLIVIGFGIGIESDSQSWLLSCYSLVCIFVAARTLSFVVSGTKNNKLLFVIPSTNVDELRQYVLDTLDRTATVINSEGLYSGESKRTLMMVISMREVDVLTAAIKEIDPDAFVIVTDAYDTYGERWNELPEKNSINLS